VCGAVHVLDLDGMVLVCVFELSVATCIALPVCSIFYFWVLLSVWFVFRLSSSAGVAYPFALIRALRCCLFYSFHVLIRTRSIRAATGFRPCCYSWLLPLPSVSRTLSRPDLPAARHRWCSWLKLHFCQGSIFHLSLLLLEGFGFPSVCSTRAPGSGLRAVLSLLKNLAGVYRSALIWVWIVVGWSRYYFWVIGSKSSRFSSSNHSQRVVFCEMSVKTWTDF
jgi:hypothetical protein